MRGRRMAYLNPIRMYVFTSAIFFIILFSLSKPEDMAKAMREDKTEQKTKTLADLRRDTAHLREQLADEDDADDRLNFQNRLEYRTIQIASIKKTWGDSTKQAFTQEQLDSIVTMAYTDSLAAGRYDLAKTKKFKQAMRRFGTGAVQDAESFNFMGSEVRYRTVEEYDSAEHALPDSLRDGWLNRFFTKRGIVIRQEWHEDRRLFVEHLLENVMHSFPKILWVSLPIFAMILNILYFRHKQYYYVNHGIFTIHVYCATFIQLFLGMMLYTLRRHTSAQWLHITIDLANFAIFLWMLIYLYKAMRGFYGQGRGKTFLKYFITMWLMFWINLFLLIVFLLISVFSV
jgi:hypothetical protein